MDKCVTCQEETKKYKCPKCTKYYCSSHCYRIHKDTPCQAIAEENPQAAEVEARIPMPFKTSDTVDIEKLEALERSEGLRNLLYNPHLRNFLKEVDSSPDAWKAIRAAMQEPLFIEFADECMKVIEPPDGNDATV